MSYISASLQPNSDFQLLKYCHTFNIRIFRGSITSFTPMNSLENESDHIKREGAQE